MDYRFLMSDSTILKANVFLLNKEAGASMKKIIR
jgi:hypothetical protein